MGRHRTDTGRESRSQPPRPNPRVLLLLQVNVDSRKPRPNTQAQLYGQPVRSAGRAAPAVTVFLFAFARRERFSCIY